MASRPQKVLCKVSPMRRTKPLCWRQCRPGKTCERLLGTEESPRSVSAGGDAHWDPSERPRERTERPGSWRESQAAVDRRSKRGTWKPPGLPARLWGPLDEGRIPASHCRQFPSAFGLPGFLPFPPLPSKLLWLTGVSGAALVAGGALAPGWPVGGWGWSARLGSVSAPLTQASLRTAEILLFSA